MAPAACGEAIVTVPPPAARKPLVIDKQKKLRRRVRRIGRMLSSWELYAAEKGAAVTTFPVGVAGAGKERARG